MISRRSFLSALGMTGASLAFNGIRGTILIPEGLKPYDGPVSAEWIAAEGLRLLASNLPYEQFKIGRSIPIPRQPGFGTQFPPDARQFGIHLLTNWKDEKLSRQEFSQRFIEPCMMRMANEIREGNAKTCFPLELPRGMDAARAINEQHGFSIRFVRSYDMTEDRHMNRFDMLTAA